MMVAKNRLPQLEMSPAVKASTERMLGACEQFDAVLSGRVRLNRQPVALEHVRAGDVCSVTLRGGVTRYPMLLKAVRVLPESVLFEDQHGGRLRVARVDAGQVYRLTLR